jgi:hypothetical protein
MTKGNPHFGSTFAERKKIRESAEAEAKAVAADEPEVEDKAVSRASTKTRKRAAKKA